jgi:RNA polymerase sigma-54 factor
MGQRMLQKLSPQQIQLMKLLQIPTATLDQRIQEELESNPALEEGEEGAEDVFDIKAESEESDDKEEDFELDDYLKEYIEDDPASYKMRGDSYVEDEEKSIPIALETSFHEHLHLQLGLADWDSDKEEMIAKQVIGSIDEDGYLRRDTDAIIDDLMFSQSVEVSHEAIEKVIEQVQTFDPPGVGCRDLQECLKLQLEAKIKRGDENHIVAKEIALKIITDYFQQFSKKHYQKLQKQLYISESELKDAIEEILKLNPKPASGVDRHKNDNSNYVVPDFIVTNKEGDLELSLNNKNAPDLKINDHYMDMLSTYKDTTKGRKSTKKERDAIMFIKQKIDSAKWFIDAIKQRQETLFNTMYSIMQFQYDFFLSGDERVIKPMILKDIAEITSLDISTVSRVANSKFVQTEFGTRRLKSFFSESLQTADGTEVSTVEVKNILSDIVKEESKKRPLSDEKLKDMLTQKGYNIARRTVAKYREQLNIPVARLRKEL